MARRLADRENILCLPGSFFGPQQDDFLRFAFANVDATRFITHVTPVEGTRAGMAGTGYGSKDELKFYGVTPGTLLDFDVGFHNDFRQPVDGAEIFVFWIALCSAVASSRAMREG